MSKKTSIGGQALIEGIMMKGPERTVIAVRTPEKNIDLEDVQEKHLKDKYKFFGLPVIRGIVAFAESMLMGYKALMISADKSGMSDLEEEEKQKKKRKKQEGKVALEETASEPDQNKKENSILMGAVMVVGSVLGVALSVFLFMYIPALIFDGINYFSGEKLSETLRPLFEGVLKICIFVGYVAAVSMMKDIKRVFMYHGAEHKSIFCYEKGLALTVENVKLQKRFHPRCGTSFLILMLVVGILINLLIVTLFPTVTNFRILWVVVKVLMLPFICGLGYELIRICGRYDNWITKIISAPGMWVQRLTTKEPEDDMLEVAIAALTAVIPEDAEKDRW